MGNALLGSVMFLMLIDSNVIPHEFGILDRGFWIY